MRGCAQVCAFPRSRVKHRLFWFANGGCIGANRLALRDGEVRFFDDTYGEDARLEKRIAATSAARGPGPRE